MPIYVARIERDGKLLFERADVTIEVLGEGQWRGRFLLPAGTPLPKRAKVELAFADGRHGSAAVHHVHPGSSKTQQRLVEVAGIGPIE